MSSDLYVPQYSNKDNEWHDFKVKQIPESLKRLCMSIGDLQFPNRWSTGQWHFNALGESKTEDMALIFNKEMYVMAFLGAAKAVFDTQPKEFTI